MDFIEPCFGIGHNLSLICQMTSEDIKHQLIIIQNHMQQEHCESAQEQRIALYKRVNSNNSTSVMVVSVHWGGVWGGGGGCWSNLALPIFSEMWLTLHQIIIQSCWCVCVCGGGGGGEQGLSLITVHLMVSFYQPCNFPLVLHWPFMAKTKQQCVSVFGLVQLPLVPD